MSAAARVIAGVVVAGVGFVTGSPFLIQFGAGLALGGITQALRPDDFLDGTDQAIRTGSRAALPVLYGERRLQPYIVFAETANNNQDLWIVAALCHGEIEEISEIYLDDKLAVSPNGFVSHPYNQLASAGIKLSHARYLGSDTQTTGSTGIQASPGAQTGAAVTADDLVTALPSKWSTAHRGRGIAYIVLRLRTDKDAFPFGFPRIEVRCKGRKVFDPRDETTAYSTNPALCQRDYLTSARYGVGATASEIDDATFEAEANHADELVRIPDDTGMHQISSGSAATDIIRTATAHGLQVSDVVWIRNVAGDIDGLNGQHTIATIDGNDGFTLDGVDLTVVYGASGTVQRTTIQNRYRCNGLLDTSRDLQTNLQALLTASRASLIWQGGVFRVFSRRVVTPTSLALTEANIVGDWSFQLPGARQSPNTVRCSFVRRDPPIANPIWQPETFDWPLPGMTNLFLQDDNGFVTRSEITLPFTVNRYMAERTAMISRREGRNGMLVQVTATEAALQLQVGDLVPVTHSTPGWTTKPLWVIAIGVRDDHLVDLLLQDYDATSYDLEFTDDAPLAPDTDLPDPFTVAAPTNLQLATGTRDPRIRATWTAAADLFADRYEIQARKSTDPVFKEYGFVAAELLEGFVGPVADGESWTVRVRTVNRLGVRSTWVSASHTVDLIVPAEFTWTVDADDTGIVYTVVFGDDCELVKVYSRQNDASGGANPAETTEYLAGEIRKGIGTSLLVATDAGTWRRTLLVGFGSDGVRGLDSGILETQATTSGAGPSAAPTTLQQVAGATPNTIPCTWDDAGDTQSETRVYVNGLVKQAHAAPDPEATTLLNLQPNTTYQVEVDHFRNGQASAKAGPVSMSTTQATLDAPTAFSAYGANCATGDPEMGFQWQLGANAGGARTVIQRSAIGDFSDAESIVDSRNGATSETDNSLSSGQYTFRARHEQTGYLPSAWSNTDTGTYGACEPA